MHVYLPRYREMGVKSDPADLVVEPVLQLQLVGYRFRENFRAVQAPTLIPRPPDPLLSTAAPLRYVRNFSNASVPFSLGMRTMVVCGSACHGRVRLSSILDPIDVLPRRGLQTPGHDDPVQPHCQCGNARRGHPRRGAAGCREADARCGCRM